MFSPIFHFASPKSGEKKCNDFKKKIAIFQMEIDRAMLKNWVEYPHSHYFPT
jgi:hypothetical protein